MNRGRSSLAFALIAMLAACVERRTSPSLEPGIPDVQPAAALTSATISQTLLASGHDPNNLKVYTTASIAPAPNALVTVAVLTHQSSSAAPAPTLTGGGMAAWDLVATVAYNGATPLDRVSIFRAMSASPGSGPITITSSVTVSNCQWIVSQWDGVDAGGTNGSGAIVQTASVTGTTVNGLTVTLAAFADPANAAYGVFGIASATVAATAGTGFTRIDEQPSGEGTIGDVFAEWALGDNTVDATWSSKSAGALGVELKAGGSSGGGGGGVSASQSTVAAAPSTFTAGSGTSTITVTAKDANGAPISGATVVLAATGTGNTLTQPSVATDANGVATGTLASTVAEAKTVSAKINGTSITQTATVTVTPGPVDASQSTITAAPASIPPNGAASTITVTAKDATGNPVSGATVVLTQTGSMSVLTQPAGPTSSSGVATGTLTSTMAEITIISAVIGGTPITQTATVTVGNLTPADITHTLLTSGNNAANQKVYTTAAISPAPNALITVAVLMRRSGGALSPIISGGGMSSWSTVASLDFDTQASPAKRLTIFRALSASPGSGPVTITFPSSVSNAQWIVSQWDGVETGGTNGSGAIVQSGTARSDGATGLAVSLAPFAAPNDVAFGVVGVAKNGPIVTPGSGLTEIAEISSGETSALQAAWGANQNSVAASWGISTKAALLAVELRAGNAAPVEPVALVEVSPQSPNVVVGSTVQLTAATLDVGGEPLIGRTITWASDAPQFATVSSAGLVTGVSVGSATISATSEGVVGTSTVTVTASAAPVASVEVTPALANIAVGGTVQMTATPKDASGQPLSGRTITWGSAPSGVATVSGSGLVTGVGAGTATITATSEGKSGSASVTVASGGTAALVGQWSAVLPSPIVEVHLHLLSDGKVMALGGTNSIAQLFDPATGLFTPKPAPAELFCSGHSFLPDGRLLVSGGGSGNGLGHPNSDLFDPVSASWTAGPNMAYARWYPTNTALPNGEMLTMAGANESGNPVPIPEIFDGTGWRSLTGASLTLPNYPRNFVAPDGRIFTAGPSKQSQWLNFSGTGSWTPGPSMNFGSRSYGSAVMYEAGKVMFVGGNSSPTATAEIIDLNQANPQWTYTGSLSYARWNLNATVLPDGQVLVVGGVNGDRSNPSLAVNQTELWNPAAGTWSLMAPSAPLLRGYHSTALLLPDGRVIHAGGGDGGGTVDNLNYEVYSPPYLFKGARPSVTGITGTAGYGQALIVQTPDGASITKVTLIHPGSVTHAFDEAQRLVSLNFSPVGGGISVTLPASANLAPPGMYMLFLVNGNGVPSIGQMIRLQ